MKNNIINVEDTWSKLAEVYGNNPKDYKAFPFNVIKRSIKKGGEFLEAGCGDGDVALFAYENGMNVVGLDISDEFVKMSNDKLPSEAKNIFFIKGDVRKMDFSTNKFDLIFSGGVVEHFNETEESILEHVRVLKQGGLFLIGVPCKQGLHYPLKLIMQFFGIWNVGFEKSYYKKEFQAKLKDCGLEIVESFFIPLLTSHNQSVYRRILTAFFSFPDRIFGGTHMQYYLCKKN
jgi:ubiquinone/menaquinone biosynthesis C-methylase UbiE